MSAPKKSQAKASSRSLSALYTSMWIVLAVSVIVVAAIVFLGRSQLPDPVPTHWSNGGGADDWTARGPFLIGISIACGVSALIVAVLLVASARVRGRDRGEVDESEQASRKQPDSPKHPTRKQHTEPARLAHQLLFAAVLVVFVPMLVASIAASTYGAVVTSNDPVSPSLGPWLLVALSPLVLWFPLLVLFGRHGRASYGLSRTKLAPLPVTPTEQETWTGQCTSRALLWTTAVLTVVFAVVFAVTVVVAEGSMVLAITWGVVLVVTVLLCLPLCAIRVRVDRRGVSVYSTYLGIRFARIPLGHIRSVSAVDANAVDWGGWGYRVSGRGNAIMLRSGPALVLGRSTGDLAISLDGAPEAAAVLSHLLAD